MKFRYVSLISLFWYRYIVQQRSHYDSPSYIAAVVEYSPLNHSVDNRLLVEQNTKNYLKFINKAASYAADIIIFPESSLAVPSSVNRSQLASYIPHPKDNIIPCTDKSIPYEYTLKSMSCAARDYQMYVVVNHREKVDCNVGVDCPADGFLIYNTNVAFDRNGKVIARYRKYHLYEIEAGINRTLPIPTTFTTDFGVTFGMFICYDLMYPTPALTLVRDLGITDILYSTHWFDQTLFFYATEVQAAFAYATDVNFLASGHNNPLNHSSGSGIYLGKQGYVDVIYENRRANVLLVAEVPKVISGKRTRNIDRSKVHVYEFTKEEINTNEKVVRDDNDAVASTVLKFFRTEPVDLKNKYQTKTVCDRGLCCEFKLTVEFDESIIRNNSKYYRYRFGAWNVSSRVDYLGLAKSQICAIMACTNETLDSCGSIFHDKKNTIMPTTFISLEISTQNITNCNNFVTPFTYSFIKMKPLNISDFSFTSSDIGNVSSYHMKLIKPLKDILSFAIGLRSSAMDGFVNAYSVI